MKSTRSDGRGKILGVAATAIFVVSSAACGVDAGDGAQGGDPADPPQEDLLESAEPENLDSVDNPEPRGRFPAVSPDELTPYSQSTGPGDSGNDPVRSGATLIGEIENTIRNTDGIRSPTVRRTAVDVLTIDRIGSGGSSGDAGAGRKTTQHVIHAPPTASLGRDLHRPLRLQETHEPSPPTSTDRLPAFPGRRL